MYFSTNLKFLRLLRKKSQEEVAALIGVPRTTLNNYENGTTPGQLQKIMDLADLFDVSIDMLLRIDLTKLRKEELLQLENRSLQYISGKNLRVLATTVDSENEDNIELVGEKAKAGYKSGYADPDYIKELPVYQLPFLPRNRKYRTFQVSGDSMLPVKDKSWITCEYVDDWNSIRDGQPYVILTVEDGIVFKLIYKDIETKKTMLLCSTNPLYKPYHISISDVKEVWKCKLLMSYELY